MMETEIEIVKSRIAALYSQKAKYNNYFNQELCAAEFFQASASVVIRVPYDGFHRVYFVSADRDELSGILRALPGTNVINMPSKGSPELFDDLMGRSGYSHIGTYERYYNTKIKMRGRGEPAFATPDDLDAVYTLFHNHFNPHVDYLPAREELGRLIRDNQIIVNSGDNGITGAFVFAFEGKKCYFRAWIDHGTTGLKLLFEAYNIMVERGCSYAYFWVNSNNLQVKSIHELLGARPDGLKDYTYTKNNN